MVWCNIILQRAALKEFGPLGLVKNRVEVNQKGRHFLTTGLNYATDDEIKTRTYHGRLQKIRIQCFPEQFKEMDKLLNIRYEPAVIITVDQENSAMIYGLDYGLKFKNYDGTWLSFEGVNDKLPSMFIREDNIMTYLSQNL